MAYVEVARLEEIPPGSMLSIEGIDRVEVCIVNVNGTFYAFSGVCTHKGAPLCNALKDNYLVCPWHGAKFRIDTGARSWPAPRPLRTYEIITEGETLLIRKPEKQ